ncbi:MAG: ATP-binding protein [Terracidiphilus sp.]|nr:ATP-binding protein [Terracidiphilus sp.]MDR3798285.1 ATP-binding protein [Terracidiphilus sp.]
MLAGLVLLEILSISLFAAILTRQQTQRVRLRAQVILSYDSASLASQVSDALEQQRPGWISSSVKTAGEAPNVAFAAVTDPAGNVLFVSKGDAGQATLDPAERAQIPFISRDNAWLFTLPDDRWEAARAIYTNNELRGYTWVEFDPSSARQQLFAIQRDTLVFGVIWVIASAILVLLMGRSIAQPLSVLHRGAAALMNSPEDVSRFPLPVTVQNEIGDLIETFNRMVASLAEQRAGLNDTLSLLDSMLANAPIGLAFVDRNSRFVRVNQIFADLTGVTVSRHLGRTLTDLLPAKVAEQVGNAVQQVFSSEEPVRNLELNGEGGKPRRPWTWLISAYPVRTTPTQVRWVGVIALDASERKRSEEALRRSEKLAVTGRLAASIAHEINNPLEAITNLHFLLRNFVDLPEAAKQYVSMAEYEVRRIAEITQQTLRFYRQPTHPARATLAELLDSVLSLYQGRINALDLRVERQYEPELTLFCFAGEIRQVFANLVGNAIDASSAGGRLLLRARRSCDWKNPDQAGIRFAIADTGSGMEPEIREHIFEAFFTTKEITGTGLGLWVSHEIILKHQGSVRVRSRVAAQGNGKAAATCGTVFEVFLPDNPGFLHEASAVAGAKTSASATA